MEQKEGYYGSSTGLDRIAYRVCYPLGKPRAILQIAHGMSEHFGRYEAFAEFLTNNGFLVCGNDHLGHGKTAVRKEDYGYFGKENGWIHMVDDMHLLTEKIQAEYPEAPYFLLGHSMGSLLARAYASVYGEDLNGLLLTGTNGGGAAETMAMPVIRRIRKSKGDRKRSKTLYALAFGAYNRKYLKERDRLSWMSQDPEVLKQFRSDPSCNFMFSTAGFEDLLSVLNYVTEKECVEMMPKELPVILLSGDMDPVGNYGKGVAKVYQTMEKAGIADLEMVIYKGMRHEILNEPEKEGVWRDVLYWLNERVGAKQPADAEDQVL